VLDFLLGIRFLAIVHCWVALALLSDRGRSRYAQYVDAPADAFGKRIQAGLSTESGGEKIWFVGIPARGDMAALETLCAERGVDFAHVSWRQ
jgi:anaerobic ribonucleoside-triphosphate reductase activating protein